MHDKTPQSFQMLQRSAESEGVLDRAKTGGADCAGKYMYEPCSSSFCMPGRGIGSSNLNGEPTPVWSADFIALLIAS
jgi:hypothetical protein